MKTIRLEELINRCLKKDDTLPRNIKYKSIEYKLDKAMSNYFYDDKEGNNLMSAIKFIVELTNVVEIIEEPGQIEKLNRIIYGCVSKSPTNEQIMNKLNEVIDYINGADSIVKTNDNR